MAPASRMHYDNPRMRARTIAAVIVGLLFVGGAAAAVVVIRHGFSARDQPTRAEAFVARRLRHLAVPGRAKALQNPVAATPDALAAARAHFADHCALCHANDGSGDTEVGRSLYPKAPDMRLPATQSLTDGELYYIIQNGVRLTGMPAWGAKDDERDEDSWTLVHLIRHLSELTPEQLKEMEGMNPRNPAELEEERAEAEFLRGGPEPPEAPPKPHASHHKH
jgi:mono/diheme cytochrome c family protein